MGYNCSFRFIYNCPHSVTTNKTKQNNFTAMSTRELTYNFVGDEMFENKSTFGRTARRLQS